MIRLVHIVAVVLLFCGCTDLGSAVGPVVPGSYRYSAYDASGTLVVQGWFSLTVHDSSSFTGEWHFTAVGNPTNIGPQVGNGALVGEIRQGVIWIELRPEYRDNNVMLTGDFHTTDFSGSWEWISFAGPTARGAFTATKI